MRNLSLAISLLSLSLPCWGAESIEDQIRAEANLYADAWNRGDSDFIDATHDSSYVLVTASGPITLEERMSSVEARMTSSDTRGTLSFHDMSVRPLGKKYALAYGRAHLVSADGTEMSVWFTSIYMRTEEGWKAIHDHG